MLAADTNVVLRLVIADDRLQHERAVQLFATNKVWIAKTVMLEANWVLRSRYHYSDRGAAALLVIISGLTNAVLEDRRTVIEALTLVGNGVDFADALHLASRGSADRFVTFDRKLARRARKAGITAIAEL